MMARATADPTVKGTASTSIAIPKNPRASGSRTVLTMLGTDSRMPTHKVTRIIRGECTDAVYARSGGALQ
jgi:hypothetical protein